MGVTLCFSHVYVSLQDKDKCTPLHEASSHGHLDAVRILIARGADVTAETSQGDTALFSAALW